MRELPRAARIGVAKDAETKLPVSLPPQGFPVAVPLKLILAHVRSNCGHVDDIPQRLGRTCLVWVLQKDLREVAAAPMGHREL